MTTTITITGRRASTHGSAPIWQRFDADVTGDTGTSLQRLRWTDLTRSATLAWLTERGLDAEHANNLLDEALVGPVSTEV